MNTMLRIHYTHVNYIKSNTHKRRTSLLSNERRLLTLLPVNHFKLKKRSLLQLIYLSFIILIIIIY